VPPVFPLMQRIGNIDREEMYQVFNMGIGMVVICAPDNVSRFTAALPGIRVIGEVVKQSGKARVVID
jgi:phosphoribosylformylglycinamidine cyclo-ligase